MKTLNIPLLWPPRAPLGGLFFTLLTLLSAPLSAEIVEVEIKKFSYHPAVVKIAVGDSVRWINRERRQHHSVQLQRDGSGDPMIDSQYLFPGDQWEHTFDKQGHYSYLCGPHPKMQGRIEVE
jgi:plastocyanin